MADFLRKYKFELLLALFITLYIAWFSFFTVQRFRTLHANYYDLGIMDQTVYNTSQGRMLELTDPNGSVTIKRMAIHNDVLLASLAPLYWIHAGPETLVVSQTVVLALGAVFIYLIALHLSMSRPLSLSFSLMYLMYPPLQWSNTYDFHVVTLATTLLLAIFYFLITKRYTIALVCLGFTLLAKEQVGLVTGFMGLLLAVKPQLFPVAIAEYKNIRKLGAIFFAMSIAWFLLSIWYIIPHFRAGEHFAIARYQEFGRSPSEVIVGIITKPAAFFSSVLNTSALEYFVALLGPVLFASLASPLIVLIGPELAINLLSNSENMSSIIFHYTALLTPFVFFAAIIGTKYISEKLSVNMNKLIIVQLILTLLFSYYMSPLPYSKHYDGRTFSQVKPELSDVDQWARRLAHKDIPVSASLGVATKFTDRIVMIPFSSHYAKADYVVLLKSEVLNDWLDPAGSKRAYEQLKNDTQFQLIYAKEGLEVYKKL